MCSSPGWRKSSLPGGFFSNLRALEPAGTRIQAGISCCYSKKATWGPFAKGAIEDSSRSVNPRHGPAAPGWRKIRAGHVWTPHPLQRPKPVPSPAKITPKSLQCFLEEKPNPSAPSLHIPLLLSQLSRSPKLREPQKLLKSQIPPFSQVPDSIYPFTPCSPLCHISPDS